MDKRRLTESYFKYTYILYKERYGLKLEIKGNIHDALENDYDMLRKHFHIKYATHICDAKGCEN